MLAGHRLAHHEPTGVPPLAVWLFRLAAMEVNAEVGAEISSADAKVSGDARKRAPRRRRKSDPSGPKPRRARKRKAAVVGEDLPADMVALEPAPEPTAPRSDPTTDSLAGGTVHEPVAWEGVLADQDATAVPQPQDPVAHAGRALAAPPPKAKRSREAAASIAIIRLHAPTDNEVTALVLEPAEARAVVESIPASRFHELAEAGGLLAYLEATHGPGRYRAVWIADDLHSLASEVIEVPDLAAAARELDRRRRAVEKEARRRAAEVTEARRAAAGARRRAEEAEVERQLRQLFVRYFAPAVVWAARKLTPLERFELLDMAEEWLDENYDWARTIPPEQLAEFLRAMGEQAQGAA